jgi:hypothetical protein
VTARYHRAKAAHLARMIARERSAARCSFLERQRRWHEAHAHVVRSARVEGLARMALRHLADARRVPARAAESLTAYGSAMHAAGVALMHEIAARKK